MTTALIIGIGESITNEQARTIRDQVEQRLPGIVCVVIGPCGALATVELEHPPER